MDGNVIVIAIVMVIVTVAAIVIAIVNCCKKNDKAMKTTITRAISITITSREL